MAKVRVSAILKDLQDEEVNLDDHTGLTEEAFNARADQLAAAGLTMIEFTREDDA